MYEAPIDLEKLTMEQLEDLEESIQQEATLRRVLCGRDYLEHVRVARNLILGSDNLEYIRGIAEFLIDITRGLDQDNKERVIEDLTRSE